MAYKVTTNHERALIDVRYSDNVSTDSRIAAMNETLLLLDSTGYRRILIDYVDARTQIDSFASLSSFATLISSNAQLRQCRISFVGLRNQQFNAVVETLAEARHYPFRRFYDRPSAIAWLLSEAPRPGDPQESRL